MNLYRTIDKEVSNETIIEKSRFIAYVKPVKSREEADEFIKLIKKKHRDATHNVPAMVLGDKMQIQWASDDGEPQGTAGSPILNMLIMENLTNLAIVVTRYFGGVKLGTGGLVRAYTNVAKACVNMAGICQVKELWVSQCEIPYSYLEYIKKEEKEGYFNLIDVVYEAKVILKVAGETENTKVIKEKFMNMTNGQCIFCDEHKEITKIPEPN